MDTDVFANVELVAFDIDGTLTDGTTTWLGPDIGWTQKYHTRDGESILRLVKSGIHAMPLSRNRTTCARVRMTDLGLPLDGLGVTDKVDAVESLAQRFGVALERICYVGDGAEDEAVFARVGCGCAVADAHPRARAAAAFVTRACGGERVMEEVVQHILEARGIAL